jgi:hypothetical protein
MNVPGFAAEASLYRTRQAYHGSNLAADVAQVGGVVPSQICGQDCYLACASVAGACGIGCFTSLLTPGTFVFPEGAGVLLAACLSLVCGFSLGGCLLNCPPCPPPKPGPGGQPDCTSTGCPGNLECCDCLDQPFCTTLKACARVCPHGRSRGV